MENTHAYYRQRVRLHGHAAHELINSRKANNYRIHQHINLQTHELNNS